MTITPRFLNGVNSDERVPITIAASPFLLSAGRKTFAVVQTGVQDFDWRIEAFAKTGNSLRRQANLRHHHQRLFATGGDIFQYA